MMENFIVLRRLWHLVEGHIWLDGFSPQTTQLDDFLDPKR